MTSRYDSVSGTMVGPTSSDRVFLSCWSNVQDLDLCLKTWEAIAELSRVVWLKRAAEICAVNTSLLIKDRSDLSERMLGGPRGEVMVA